MVYILLILLESPLEPVIVPLLVKFVKVEAPWITSNKIAEQHPAIIAIP